MSVAFGQPNQSWQGVTLVGARPMSFSFHLRRNTDLGRGRCRGFELQRRAAFERLEDRSLLSTLEALEVPPDSSHRNYVVLGADQGSLVIVQDARTRAEVFRFEAFPGFTGGVQVAAGDVTGDGIPEIIAGAGNGGNSHVKVFDGASGGLVSSFLAFPGFSGAV